MTKAEKRRREARLLVLSRLCRAQDRLQSAIITARLDGVCERLEIEIVHAMSELDQAEKLVIDQGTCVQA